MTAAAAKAVNWVDNEADALHEAEEVMGWAGCDMPDCDKIAENYRPSRLQ